jgi:hypothetical protein
LHDEPYAIDAKNLVLLEVEVASAETIATNTTEGGATADRVGETTADTKTIEVGNGNSVAPSTITIGHVRSVTTRISPSETYVTDAMNLALAVEAAVGVDHETTTEDKVEAVTISAPHTVATDDKAGETTEDSETTETVATDDKAGETTEDSETTETVATDERADETTEDSETTETVATDEKADETTEDSETTETVATDDRADETVVAKATTVQPAGVGNEMDDLSETLQTTTSVEQRGSDRAMPTTDHRVISEPHANLSEKTSERMWPRERRITLPQRS